MYKISKLGTQALIEVSTAEIDQIHDFKTPESLQVREKIVNAISQYLTRQIPFENALKIFEELNGHAEPLYKLRDIVEVDNTPIPTSGDGDEHQKKSRSWSAAEDLRLLAGIYRNGLDNWSTISMFVGNGRTRAQCHQRWTRGLNPRISKDSWTPEEESMLITYVRQFGDKWTKIATLLGNRCDVQCRYHYHQLSKNGPHFNVPMELANGAMTLMPPNPQGGVRFSVPNVALRMQGIQPQQIGNNEARRASTASFLLPNQIRLFNMQHAQLNAMQQQQQLTEQNQDSADNTQNPMIVAPQVITQMSVPNMSLPQAQLQNSISSTSQGIDAQIINPSMQITQSMSTNSVQSDPKNPSIDRFLQKFQ